jgi:hypothetical protein
MRADSERVRERATTGVGGRGTGGQSWSLPRHRVVGFPGHFSRLLVLQPASELWSVRSRWAFMMIHHGTDDRTNQDHPYRDQIP